MVTIEGMARYLTAEHKPPKGKPKEDSTEPPACYDHYRTCYGCPDRVAVPRCHMTCEGYKARQAEAPENETAERDPMETDPEEREMTCPG
jgi:hypothetical protein